MSMINTWLRIHKVLPAGTANFPPVPLEPQTWMNEGLRLPQTLVRGLEQGNL
jgi:hypothetical protein